MVGEKRTEGIALFNMALCYSLQGNLVQSIEMGERSQSILEGIEDPNCHIIEKK